MTFSILIPTYNDSCYALVKTLRSQLMSLNVEWEIIVADDCSTDKSVRDENAKIEKLGGCRVEWGRENVGRAAIRNFLADKAAGDWLLYVDSGNRIDSPDYMQRYAEFFFKNSDAECVVYGGRVLNKDADATNLRYQYERAWADKGTVEARKADPYANFNTCNFLISRATMLRIPFNEEMKLYGFEDVLLGKQLKEARVPIYHIDNPVTFGEYESNAEFLRKTEEAVRMQVQFKDLIGDYSNLLRAEKKVKRFGLSGIMNVLFKITGGMLRRHLLGQHPKAECFNLYKLMLLNALMRTNNK